MRQKLFIVTQSLRLPSICTLCSQFHKSNHAVCERCIEFMPLLGLACRHCATPLADAGSLICGSCIKKPPQFEHAYITYKFEEPLRGLLHQFKYHNGLYLHSFLSHLMLNGLPDSNLPQCLIPVPMHARKIKQRGFNHAAILTRGLAKKLNLPYDLTSCQKILNTAPQASLDKKQRQSNLRHAFISKKLPFQHVALVDDLLTTGSTANELALTLKKSGVERVDLWCCARTVFNANS
ncbi:ComF family protein [Legionella rowbothamii]|uniref:ComF family protein n=1 Tax=Legionella rowbothamii TaxID=96229 RepID=UPI003BF8D031